MSRPPAPLLVHWPLLLLIVLCHSDDVMGQGFQANYDEAKVPAYTLPDVLLSENGTRIRNARQWREIRRPELLQLFEREMFGRAPGRPTQFSYYTKSVDSNALNGAAIRKEITLHVSKLDSAPAINLLMYLPKNRPFPRPAFLGPNFEGNHTVQPDPGITLPTVWQRSGSQPGLTPKLAEESTRGSKASRWPAELILERGYALVTFYYGDVDPDFHDGFTNGIHALYRRPDRAARAPDDWGSIAAWAWGLSRALDYLEADHQIDATRVAVIGHSRLGKTALWAGASDERFAIVISNDSGCGGAALSRRAFGETVGRINTSFPHWFCDNFKKYNNNEAALPFDQHELIALIAPRPVYVASAVEDRWADPRGEFLSALHAEPVYRLFNKRGLGVKEMPGVDQPVGRTIGYHIRSGAHDVTRYDWEQYLDFADSHIKR